jgi:hypothetical protein
MIKSELRELIRTSDLLRPIIRILAAKKFLAQPFNAPDPAFRYVIGTRRDRIALPSTDRTISPGAHSSAE